jgi:hypothetical protein
LLNPAVIVESCLSFIESFGRLHQCVIPSWFSTRCWLWYEVVRCRGLSKGCFGKIPGVRMGLWTVWKGTSCMVWDSGQIGKIPEVWCGFEDISFVESHA